MPHYCTTRIKGLQEPKVTESTELQESKITPTTDNSVSRKRENR